jgi:glycosyltransferase involved in cell wall biosynthesis
VAVIIPCLDEELTVASVVRSFREALPGAQIVVVDNGSRDATAARAAEAGADVIHVGTRGKGAALRRGLADVEADCYVMVDGDGTYEATLAPQLVNEVVVERVDLSIAVRATPPDSEAYRSGHRVGNRILSWIFRRLFGLALQDALSGYRAMSRRFAKTFVDVSVGFEVETDLNAHAALLRARVSEIPGAYAERPHGSTSKLRTYGDGWSILRRNLRLFRDARPQLSFAILASPWLLLSVILVSTAIVDYLETGLVLRFPSLIAGVGAFLVALNLWSSGLVIDRVNRARSEVVKLHYLGIPLHRPAAPSDVRPEAGG